MENNPIPKIIVTVVVFFLLVACIFSTYFTIDQGERGVILHNGALVGEAEPGLHFKMPFITGIEKVSVQVQKEAFEKTNDMDSRPSGILA